MQEMKRSARRLMMAVLFAMCGVIAAQSEEEYQVKAAFLYNFTMFVEWHGAPLVKTEDSLVLCVSGGRARARVVADTLSSKKGVVVRAVKIAEEPKGCTVLFQTAGEKPIRENWSELARSGILVVTEDPAQLARGSILNFFLAQGKVRFEANPDGAKASGFRLNSQLLQLARIVRTEGVKE
jgi:hypothetical protein